MFAKSRKSFANTNKVCVILKCLGNKKCLRNGKIFKIFYEFKKCPKNWKNSWIKNDHQILKIFRVLWEL